MSSSDLLSVALFVLTLLPVIQRFESTTGLAEDSDGQETCLCPHRDNIISELLAKFLEQFAIEARHLIQNFDSEVFDIAVANIVSLQAKTFCLTPNSEKFISLAAGTL